jgi:hypothetical protein
MCIRYFRGVYQYENVLSMKERTIIWRLLERKKKFGQKLAMDEQIRKQPFRVGNLVYTYGL